MIRPQQELTKHLRFIDMILSCQFWPLVRDVRDSLGIDKEDIIQECLLYLLQYTIPTWLKSDQEHSCLTYIKNGLRWQLLKMMKQVESKQGRFNQDLRTKNIVAYHNGRWAYTRINPESVPSQDVFEDTVFEQLDRQLDAKMFCRFASWFWTKREKKIIKMYFFDDLTYEEIGQSEGVTRDRIRQIVMRANQKVICRMIEHHNDTLLRKLRESKASSKEKAYTYCRSRQEMTDRVWQNFT